MTMEDSNQPEFGEQKRRTTWVYLAASFDAAALMKSVGDLLVAADVNIRDRSTWYRTDHGQPPYAHEYLAEMGYRDLVELNGCQALVLFNPPEMRDKGTGGRHVETGYAIARAIPIILIGEPSNAVHYNKNFINKILPFNHDLFELIDAIREVTGEA